MSASKPTITFIVLARTEDQVLALEAETLADANQLANFLWLLLGDLISITIHPRPAAGLLLKILDGPRQDADGITLDIPTNG